MLSRRRAHARVISVVFLLLLVLGPFALVYVPSVVYTPGDAGLTAQHVLEHTGLLRAGLLAELTIALSEVAMVMALYRLFAPGQEGLALLAASARGIMAALQGVNVTILAFIIPLAASHPDLVELGFVARGGVEAVWQAFFGMHCGVLGLLIARSTLVPRWLGPLMSVAGLAYVAMGVGYLVVPEAGIEGVAALFALLEIPFFGWVLFRGVPDV